MASSSKTPIILGNESLIFSDNPFTLCNLTVVSSPAKPKKKGKQNWVTLITYNFASSDILIALKRSNCWCSRHISTG